MKKDRKTNKVALLKGCWAIREILWPLEFPLLKGEMKDSEEGNLDPGVFQSIKHLHQPL